MSCDALDPYFLINGVGSVVTFGLLCYFTHLNSKKPVVGVIDWGKPLVFLLFFCQMAFWNMLPATIFFAIFHETIPDMYEGSREMSCVEIQRFPFHIFIVAKLFVIIFLWIPGRVIDEVGDTFYESPQHPVKDGEKLIVLGVTARGGLFIRMLQRFAGCAVEKAPNNIQCAENRASTEKQPLLEVEGEKVTTCGMPHNNVQAHLVDYTAESKHAVIVNALATGVVKSADELHVICPEPSAKCLFTLPYDDNSIDRVVLTPFFRGSAPAAPNKFVKEKTVERNMRLLLAEALRVLRKGGTIVFVDALFDVLLVQADLRDMGFTTTIEDLHTTLGLAPKIFQKEAWRLCGTKENDPVVPDVHAVDVKHTENALSQPLYSETFLLGLAWVQQTIVFAIFCWLTAVVYPHTSVPRNIEPSERLNNGIVVCTLGYPISAFFARGALQFGRGSITSGARLLLFFAVMEVICVFVSFVVTPIILFVPRMSLQEALNGTPVSPSSRTMISIPLTIAVITCMILRVRKNRRRKTFEVRKLPMEFLPQV